MPLWAAMRASRTQSGPAAEAAGAAAVTMPGTAPDASTVTATAVDPITAATDTTAIISATASLPTATTTTRTASHYDRHYDGRRHDTSDCRNYHHYLRNGDHDYHKHHDDNGHNTPAVIRE